MKLLLDIGNTRAKYCIVDETDNIGEIHHCSIEDLLVELGSVLRNIDVQGAVISNVGGEITEVVRFLETKLKKVLLVNGQMDLPITIKYSTLNTLGADRVCAIIGAWWLYPKEDVIVFDFGTALTIDFLSAQGEYQGGNISLGFNTRFKALNHYTSRLPEHSIVENYPEIGTTTDEAIIAGISQGIVFEVNSYISLYPKRKIIFTGGDAFFLAKKINYPTFVVCNLVFIGLLRIYKYSEKKVNHI